MPTYEYRCTSCGRSVEVMHAIDGSGPSSCDACGADMRKALSLPAIVFKGSGWAKKDARAGAAPAKAAAGSASGEAAGGEGGSKAAAEGTAPASPASTSPAKAGTATSGSSASTGGASSTGTGDRGA